MTTPAFQALPLTGDAVTAFHGGATASYFTDGRLTPPDDTGALWLALWDNHRNNMLLWAEEDLARRRHVPDAEIAANKRAIDRYNQARNDAIERIDDGLLAVLGPASGGGGRLNSETPGSIIDRLSIASLKIHHMGVQVRRDDVDEAHREACAERLSRLRQQRGDLADCLDELLDGCRRGLARFAVYRQFKMYNDPRLNMALVQEGRLAGSAPAASLSTALR
jgi:hypothetical protein